MTLAPAPFILAATMAGAAAPPLWHVAAAAVAALACLLAALLLLRRPLAGRICAVLALSAGVIAVFPFLVADPVAALLAAVAVLATLYALADFRVLILQPGSSSRADRCLQRAQWSAFTVPLLVVATVLVDSTQHRIADLALAASAVVTQMLAVHWRWHRPPGRRGLAGIGLALLLAGAVLALLPLGHVRPAALAAGLLTILVLPGARSTQDRHEHWWETLINHPARVLLSTFFGLCCLGTVLLLLPGATTQEISLVDAAFTAVSAVCVTGLVVFDTSRAFTPFGQALIALLIQLGGLGIMTIATVAMHVLGRRLSLRQERLMTIMTDTGHQDLLASLITVLRFTFFTEALGAVVLAGLFLRSGDHPGPALWQGVFTAISAFCNAGFALQSDNLIPYQDNPLILHTVALLIICGGLAPATCLMVPRWLAGRRLPVAMLLALVTTAVLLVVGTFLILVFEWQGVLAGMGFAGKLHNAWFQSVTLRTAGFNSVDLTKIGGPAFLVMILWMFIGGSPGGTAGGVKTTTIAVLVLTFWASVTGRGEVIVRHRRITPGTINRAVTIVGSGMLLWLVLLLMLEITQQIPARDLVFELTSAMGTVGLSTGATPLLDGIGKIIIMWGMFIGRVGPMTLFMLLSEEHFTGVSRSPDAHITLT